MIRPGDRRSRPGGAGRHTHCFSRGWHREPVPSRTIDSRHAGRPFLPLSVRGCIGSGRETAGERMQLTLPVREVSQATPRARIVRLELGRERFEYHPGQAVMVGLPGQRRAPYSIAAAPHDAESDGCLELLVGTEGNSPEFQHALEPGVRLDVHGPVGQFTFAPRAGERRFAFIAAGTGIAPLRAMLRAALLDSGHDVTMVYSARMPDEFAYHDELLALARAGRITLHLSATRLHAVRGWKEGRGRIGREHVQQIVRQGAPLCFICGPTPFVAGTRRMLLDAGLPQDRVRVEQWLLPRPGPVPAAAAGLTRVVPSLAVS